MSEKKFSRGDRVCIVAPKTADKELLRLLHHRRKVYGKFIAFVEITVNHKSIKGVTIVDDHDLAFVMLEPNGPKIKVPTIYLHKSS